MRPFLPLLINWSGKTDLKTINQIESAGSDAGLVSKQLFSALYLNELLVRLLHPYQEHVELFDLYRWALQALHDNEAMDIVLRQFELRLMDLLGYGLCLFEDEQGEAIVPESVYGFDSERGFVIADADGRSARVPVFLGSDLLALAEFQFNDQVRQAAKRLCRQVLAHHLGGKPLKSRELFV
jgi:DNA repair protein RecO (recombination protein O)